MEKQEKPNYAKRTQKDYSLSFKLGIVNEIKEDELTRLSTKAK